MAISLASITRTTLEGPPRIIIYGAPGIGKTSFAAEFPKPIFIRAEDGIPYGLEVDAFPVAQSFSEVMDALTDLVNGDHDYQTVVIDSLDKVEQLIQQDVCDRNGWDSIDTPKFGKGHSETKVFWEKYFIPICAELRNKRHMAIIQLSHETVEPVNDPEVPPYDRHNMHLHKLSRPLLQNEADAILFIRQSVVVSETQGAFGAKERKAKSSGKRIIYTTDHPTRVAKNRFGFPDQITYELGAGYTALEPYMRPAAPPPANAHSTSKKDKAA